MSLLHTVHYSHTQQMAFEFVMSTQTQTALSLCHTEAVNYHLTKKVTSAFSLRLQWPLIQRGKLLHLLMCKIISRLQRGKDQCVGLKVKGLMRKRGKFSIAQPTQRMTSSTIHPFYTSASRFWRTEATLMVCARIFMVHKNSMLQLLW